MESSLFRTEKVGLSEENMQSHLFESQKSRQKGVSHRYVACAFLSLKKITNKLALTS